MIRNRVLPCCITSAHSTPLVSHLVFRKKINWGQGTANLHFHNKGMVQRKKKSPSTLHPGTVTPPVSTSLLFLNKGCLWLSKILKTAVLRRATVANSGTYSIQEASSIHPTVTWPYLQGRRDVCPCKASSPATTKAATPPRATGRNFKIKFGEARP